MKTKKGLPSKFFKIRVTENKKIVHEYTYTDFLEVCKMGYNVASIANKDGEVLIQYFYCGASVTEDLLWETRVNSGALLTLQPVI
jgi:hypothetical protein